MFTYTMLTYLSPKYSAVKINKSLRSQKISSCSKFAAFASQPNFLKLFKKKSSLLFYFGTFYNNPKSSKMTNFHLFLFTSFLENVGYKFPHLRIVIFFNYWYSIKFSTIFWNNTTIVWIIATSIWYQTTFIRWTFIR